LAYAPAGSGANVSEELAKIIREEIRANGPIPFSRWMELCLYHPRHGYYMKPRPAGRRITGPGADADFVTPPTLHPFFAVAVARELGAMWKADGNPDAFTIVEYGGGEGALATAAMNDLEQDTTGARWLHVERSPSHRPAVGGHPRIGATLDGAAGDVGMFCEVLDAIPSPASGDGIEMRIGLAAEGFGPSRKLDWVDGRIPAAWLAARCARLRHALVIDYGTRRPAMGVRGLAAHGQVDPFAAPGDHDITFDVDFQAVATAMAAAGFKESSFETMEQFLLRHGILDELNRIDRSTIEGASSYLRLRQLLLPTGMGQAFKVQRFDRWPSGASAASDGIASRAAEGGRGHAALRTAI
jgi:NADH dehydrogenase [ubiquinone] 1 alpha subcomplex assembly factor 7